MQTLRYIGWRLAALLGVLVVSSFLVFGSMYLAPGSPEQFLVGNRSVSPEVLASIRAQYGLDDPFLVRYWHWLTGVLQGDLGRSIISRQDVATLIGDRLPTTLALTAFAAVLIIVCGVGLGILAGLKPNGALGNLVLLGSNLGFAVPTFFAAMLLLTVFNVWLGWFPSFGSGQGFAGRLWHLTLPALALSLPSIAVVARITRTSILEEAESEHVMMAIARGVKRRVVLQRHVVRNSLLPITTIVGVHLAGLIAGGFVVEHAFTLDGIGNLLVSYVQQQDFAVVQAVALVLVAIFGIVNLVIDLLYVAIDPRVATGKEH
ncbi:ABC transporter permease [Leucobacter sp. M11]|uniref:ABC transporter permease n=1 Tax=Leucobacter sp. M11 TaxID=2993565 RepID=UPI002D7FD639|nr:ABC transporter permease [Leucobacter sp. M11]MEB4615065.1 ABC transporter permease [Leucobacter sp. M11]